MQINTNNLVSITEANQNFSRVARLVDENGAAVILKNNVPRYVLLEFSQFQNEELADFATVEEVGESIVKRHLSAFQELAK
ncbi:MAG: type II toxin-antitoxin system Phd/YefM family antitoxin [Epulopiscium sp.]|jgi:antitoxin Phd|nr:type II toxin-antitoxin system Phd/YefM family antitoxin [Candidatus Epulonipiscium sp.]